MVINKIVRYFSGNVRFNVSNGFGERLINLCAANNINMWDFKKTPEGFCATVCARDYKRVKAFAKKANVNTGIESKKGFAFKANRYKSRWGLIIGIFTFATFIVLMQSFVWQIEVVGNKTVSTEIILSELKEIGVHKLSFIPDIDFRMKKQEALLKLPQLSWLTINRKGCKLTVEVSERHIAPFIRENAPCDIIAGKTGAIRYMEVYNGVKMIEEQNTVMEGDVIVSGRLTDKKGEVSYVHSEAKVIAEVQFDKTLSVDLNQLQKDYTGKTKNRHYLTLFSLKIPLFIATDVDGDYDLTAQNNPCSLFGKEMPIGIYSLHYRFYNKKPQRLTADDAKTILLDKFKEYEAVELKDTAIISRDIQEKNSDGVYYMTVSYIAEQDIAKKSEIDIKQ